MSATHPHSHPPVDDSWSRRTDPPAPFEAAVRGQVSDMALSKVFHSLEPFPGNALFLGVCEDGLPLLVDLANPDPGAILILGDREAANLDLIRTMIASVVLLDASPRIQVDVASAYPTEYRDFYGTSHQFSMISLDGTGPSRLSNLEDLLSFYVSKIREAALSGYPQEARLLVIDDLDFVLNGLSSASLNALDWVVQYGPREGVWVTAGLHTRDFKLIDDPILRHFQTRIFGQIQPPWLAEYLTMLPADVSASLAGEDQFCARVAGKTFAFWLPRYDL